MGQRNHSHWNGDAWKFTATDAAKVLDVDVQEVLIGAVVRMGGWCHVRHKEQFFRWTRDMHNLFAGEEASRTLDLPLLGCWNVVMNFSKLERHRFGSVINGTWSDSGVVHIFKDIVGEVCGLDS